MIAPNQSLKGLFDKKWILFLPIKVFIIYVNSASKQAINELYELSKLRCRIFCNDDEWGNGCFAKSKEENSQGLRKVSLMGRLNETSFICF